MLVCDKCRTAVDTGKSYRLSFVRMSDTGGGIDRADVLFRGELCDECRSALCVAVNAAVESFLAMPEDILPGKPNRRLIKTDSELPF